MKKYLSYILVVVMCLSLLTGCNYDPANNNTENDDADNGVVNDQDGIIEDGDNRDNIVDDVEDDLKDGANNVKDGINDIEDDVKDNVDHNPNR